MNILAPAQRAHACIRPPAKGGDQVVVSFAHGYMGACEPCPRDPASRDGVSRRSDRRWPSTANHPEDAPWQAVIVYLFPGGAARGHSSSSAASLEAGIDALGARGDFQRHYSASIGTIDGQVAGPLAFDGASTRSTFRFNARMTPMRANIVGPPCVATRFKAYRRAGSDAGERGSLARGEG